MHGPFRFTYAYYARVTIKLYECTTIDIRAERSNIYGQRRSRGPQLVVRAYEIFKSDKYNEDFRISRDFRWDFRIAQALAGISDYRQKISRDFRQHFYCL